MEPISGRGDEPPRILLVDDSQEELRVLSGMLRVERFRLTVAGDGRQGYQRAVVVQPDLILMDVQMPQMDGFTACRLLKTDSATRHIPLIFLTSRTEAEERLRGFRLGAVDYVSKPFLAEEVVARINVHLQRGAVPSFGEASPTGGRNEGDVLARAAAQLIQDHLEDLPPVPEIARLVGTHEKRLRQLFHDCFGMPVSTFVREARIRAACLLLSDTEMSVLKIAGQVGFASARNFSTAFRERMGVAPLDFRSAQQEARRIDP